MKKNLVSMFALASMLLATGCSQEDELVNSSNDYVDASFTVELGEGAQSRALGDGTQVNELLYGIFDQNGNAVPVIAEATDVTAEGYTPDYIGEATITGGTATVKMRLVKGQTYDFVFWAQVKGNAYYTHSNDLKQISVSYDSYANDEKRDAFFNHVDDYTVVSHFTKTVELRRPFGQLNVGTAVADYKAAEVLLGDSPVTKSELVVAKIPNTLNLLDGSIEGASANATFQMAYLPKDAATNEDYETIAVDADNNGTAESYVHLSMNYLLADVKEGTNSYLYDVTLKFANQEKTINEIAVPQIPVHRNYKTNIVGNILTTQGDFTVIVKPEFETPDNIIPVWDGTSVEEVTVNAEGVYEIYNAAQLAWVAQQVDKADANNSEGSNFKDQTVKLMSDIDLANNMWNPIGTDGDTQGFEGIFDGNGKTISNLYVDLTNVPAYQSAGLFANARYATIKNFTVKNAVVKNLIKCGDATDCGAAVVLGSAQFPVTIENVDVVNAVVEGNKNLGGIAGYFAGTIKNCDVDGIKLTATPDNLNNPAKYDNGDKVGGILGYHNTITNGTNLTENNTVNDFEIRAYRDMGGIAGCGRGTFNNNRATNGIITVDQATNFYESKDANAAAIVGRTDTNPTIENADNYENVTITNVDNVIRTQGAFESALATGSTIYVGKNTESGNYTWKNPSASFAIVGVEEGVVINMGTGRLGANDIDASFDGVTLNYTNNNYTGFHQSASETYKNCTINGVVWTYAPKASFEGCTFNQTGDAYNIWMYGADKNVINVVDCEFTSYCKSILIYAESAKVYDVTVKNSTFTSEKYDGKAAVQIHSEKGVNGTLTMNNVSVSGKYLESQMNGGLWNEKVNGDGSSYGVKGTLTDLFVKTIDGITYVQTADGLTKAAASVADGATIAFTRDLAGDAIADQREDIDVVIDGKGFKYDGTIDIYGHARSTGEETLTFKNIKFETSTKDRIFISCNTTESAKRYAHNVKVENCTFTALGEAKYTAQGMKYRQCYNMSVEKSSFVGMHSLMWATGGNGVTIEQVTVSDCKNGVSFGTTDNVMVKNSMMTAVGEYGYALRAKASGAYNMTVESCSLKADAPILIREAKADYALTLKGNNVLTTTKDYQIIVASNDYEDGKELAKQTSGSVIITGAPATMKIFK